MEQTHHDIFRARYLKQVRTFDGASGFVATLHRMRIEVVIASSATQADLDHYIQLLQVKHLLTATTCADDVKRSKPARDIFAPALEKSHAVLPEHALAVGDTPYDIIAAAKCVVATVAVLSGGFSELCLRDAGARRLQQRRRLFDLSDLAHFRRCVLNTRPANT